MIRTQYPYIDDNGGTRMNLVKTWTDDPTKTLLQVETGVMYDEAIDLFPCQFTYKEVDKPVEEEQEENNEEETPEENETI